MPTVAAPPEELALTLRIEPVIHLTEERLFEFCTLNPELRIERTAEGELIVMSPLGGETSYLNLEIAAQLHAWSKRDGTGRAFDSSGGFLLPDGSMRSPDAAWVENTKLRALSTGERRRFLPLCPSFVIELRSPSDALANLAQKMRGYLRNGARLGWLIDPVQGRAHIYRPGHEIAILDRPAVLEGRPELRGLKLDLAEIWQPEW